MNKEKFYRWDFAFLVLLPSNRISKLSNIFHKRLQFSLQAPLDMYQGQVLFESSCRARSILISSDLNILLRFTSTTTKIKTKDEDDGDDERDLRPSLGSTYTIYQEHLYFRKCEKPFWKTLVVLVVCLICVEPKPLLGIAVQQEWLDLRPVVHGRHFPWHSQIDLLCLLSRTLGTFQYLWRNGAGIC